MKKSEMYIQQGNYIVDALKKDTNRKIKQYTIEIFCEDILPILFASLGIWIISFGLLFMVPETIGFIITVFLVVMTYSSVNIIATKLDRWWDKKWDFELSKNLELSTYADLIWSSVNKKVAEVRSYELFCDDDYLLENIIHPLQNKGLSEETIILICDYLQDETIKGNFKNAIKYINENFGVKLQ